MSTQAFNQTKGAVPLPIAGDTTDEQTRRIRSVLGDAMDDAVRRALENLDCSSAAVVLEVEKQLQREVAEVVLEVIHRGVSRNKFRNEEVSSSRVYPANYAPRSVEAQVTALRKAFPALRSCNEKLARFPLPAGAEAWFAIPRWQSLAPNYNEAVQMIVSQLSEQRRVANRLVDKIGSKYLVQSTRARQAEKILNGQQNSNDILVVGAQLGMLHRGASARRAREMMLSNEYGLGLFSMACILLTHPERMSNQTTLMIDCSGDAYSLGSDYAFDRVPLLEFDISGLEVSIFYEDRACEIWGTPSGFLCKTL